MWHMGNWHVSIQPQQYGRDYEFWMDLVRGNKAEVLQPDGSMREIGLFTSVNEPDGPKPTAILPRESLGSIMDALWEMGVRPKDRRYEEELDLLREQLAIQTKHLEDMRALVFSGRKVDE